MRGKATVSLCLILCLLSCALSGRSLSQTRGPKSPEEYQRWVHEQRLKEIQKQADIQRKMEEQRFQFEERQKAVRKLREEYTDEAWQDALGATAEQWKAIKPKLERIRQLRNTPSIDIYVYASGGSGGSRSESFSFSEGSGGSASGGARGGYSSRSAGGSGGAGGSGYRASGGGTGNAAGSGQVTAGTPGTQGTFFSGGGATSSASGYSFSAGGAAGPVKKQVGDVSLGWQWRRPSLNKESDKLTEGDKACEQLLRALEIKSSNPEQVRQRLEALRKIREQRRADLRETQRQLRETVTPEQETKLILMGYLD